MLMRTEEHSVIEPGVCLTTLLLPAAASPLPSISELHLSRQHSFLPWKHFSADHLQQLASQSPEERRDTIRTVLSLADRFPTGEVHVRDVSGTAEQRRASQSSSKSMVDPNLTRREVLVDFALGVLGFCWSAELSAIKTSTFFSILYSVHQTVSEVPGPQPPAAEAWAYFESLLLRHSIERPPFSIACFAPNEVAALSEWTLRTYFAQLRHYQYVFGTANELEIEASNSIAECVNPLTVGVPLFSGQPVAQEWTLEWAKNYFPHSDAAAAAQKPYDEDALEDDDADLDADDDEFRDDSTGVEFLRASSALALDGAHTASAAAVAASSGLLADPEDQALFDAAMSRSLRALEDEFGSALRRQQETFARRLAEIDPAGTQANNTAGNTHRSNAAASAGTRPSKSRGKQ